MVIQKNKQPLLLTMEYGSISVTQLKKCNDYNFIRSYKSTVIQFTSAGLSKKKKNSFLFHNLYKNVNFECFSIA